MVTLLDHDAFLGSPLKDVFSPSTHHQAQPVNPSNRSPLLRKMSTQPLFGGSQFGGLQRQRSVEVIQQNPGNTSLANFCCIMPPAVAALVIASDYDADESACSADNFTIGLQTFLYVSGGVGIGMLVYSLCIVCLAKMKSVDNAMSLLGGPACCSFIFSLVWAGIGLHMYSVQMSSECQDEEIATMILAWSVIQVSLLSV